MVESTFHWIASFRKDRDDKLTVKAVMKRMKFGSPRVVRGEEQALRPCAFSVYARRGFAVGHLQGNLNAASSQGVIPTVCGAVALCGLRKTNIHHPTTPTLSNLIPETSGPDKPANEAFLAALSVCLPSGASDRQCQTLQTASGKISQPIPSIQPSVYTGAIRVVCCKPG
ncbi:hypothetical protein D4764_03G0010470 [Takifugu flavidus]|uniref:Uncharacterized protein n=1 Tax=Takifugu flavidus TaxID=433684 RepID=A0A5C6NB34_9TELE|nr:hypothetical protein D4764_03G0010470 [Takifugu flavidus]